MTSVIYFFLLNLIIIVIKKNLSNPWVQLDPTQPMWVGLNFFFTHHGGLGQKIPSTQPIHTPKKGRDESEVTEVVR